MYAAMIEASPDSPGLALNWGRMLASPAVVRPAEACAAVEKAVFEMVFDRLKGQRVADAEEVAVTFHIIDEAVSICLGGLANFTAGIAAPGSLPALTDHTSQLARTLDAPLVSRCVKARETVYRTVVLHGLWSRIARRSVYRYIRAVRESGSGCRGPLDPSNKDTSLGGGGDGDIDVKQVSAATAANAALSHQRLIHQFQSYDFFDPWLQWEWGTSLFAAEGARRAKEAAQHWSVALTMFVRHRKRLQRIQGPEANRGGGPDFDSDATEFVDEEKDPIKRANDVKPGGRHHLSSAAGLEDLSGRKVDADEALRLAMQVADEFVDAIAGLLADAGVGPSSVGGGGGGKTDGGGGGASGPGANTITPADIKQLRQLRCDSLYFQCDLHFRHVAMSRRQGDAPGAPGCHAPGGECWNNLQRCLGQMLRSLECKPQVAALGRHMAQNDRAEEKEAWQSATFEERVERMAGA